MVICFLWPMSEEHSLSSAHRLLLPGAGGRDVAAGPALGRRRTGTRQRREYSVATSKVWATAALWEGFQSLRRWGGDEVTARAGLRYNKEVRPYKPVVMLSGQTGLGTLRTEVHV